MLQAKRVSLVLIVVLFIIVLAVDIIPSLTNVLTNEGKVICYVFLKHI